MKSQAKNSGDLHHGGECKQRLSIVAGGGQQPEFQMRWKDTDRKVMKNTKCGEKGNSHADCRKVTQDFEQPEMTDASQFPYNLLPLFRCGQRKAGWGYFSPQ